MISLLRNRRSIRKFTSKPIDESVLSLLKESLLRAPTSRGINHWEFIFITEKKLLDALSDAKENGSGFVKNAPLAIVVCGNEKKSDVWVEDCSIASIIVQLTAHALGLGSCWVQIRNRKHSKECSAENFVQNLLSIPEYIRVESIIVVGEPGEKPEPIPKEELDFSKIHLNSYNNLNS